MVRRHHIPRRPRGGGGADRLLVGGPVLVPVPALGQIASRELPVLGGVVQALEKSLLLLLAGEVQEDLHDPGAGAGKVALEGVDVLVAVLPHGLRGPVTGGVKPAVQQLGVHPDHQDLLVVGAVEDPDPPTLGERLAVAPQEVMLELLGGGLLERLHIATLRVHPRHDVLDGPVLAGGVHGLEDDQQGVAVARPQQLLGRRQLIDVGLEVLLGHPLGLLLAGPQPVSRGRLGAPLLEAGRLPRGDLQLLDDGLAELHLSSFP